MILWGGLFGLSTSQLLASNNWAFAKISVQQHPHEMCQEGIGFEIKTSFPTLAWPPNNVFLNICAVHKIWSTIFPWAPRYNQNMACVLFRVYSLHMHELSYQRTQPKNSFSWSPSAFNQYFIVFVLGCCCCCCCCCCFCCCHHCQMVGIIVFRRQC